jgi:mono/diheme cytochrome c family protein
MPALRGAPIALARFRPPRREPQRRPAAWKPDKEMPMTKQEVNTLTAPAGRTPLRENWKRVASAERSWRGSVPAALVLLALAACGDPASPTKAPGSGLAARGLDAAQVARGERIYNTHCASCHGPRGAATPDWRKPGADGKYPPPPLDDTAHAWHHPTEVLRKVIRSGSPPNLGNMPAWEGKLTDAEIADVVAYIKSLWSDPVYAQWKQIEQQAQAR